MQAAQQVHGVCKIAPRMTARGFQQSIEVRMASASFARDTCELRFGNADRIVADGPVNCHSTPLVLSSGEVLFESSYRKGVKTRFMCR
jgi:hypothetical protein